MAIGEYVTRSDPLASDSDPQDGNWLQPEATPSASPEAAPAPAPIGAPPPPPHEPVAVPVYWLVDHAAAPIRYRTIVDLAKLSPLPDRLLSLVYGYQPAVKLALAQRPEGNWHNAMLTVPAARATDFEGVGTIVAYRRLLEYGWDREAPPLFHARRLLFRLLAEDNDPSLLFELAAKGKGEEDGVRRNRALLREAAAAALAQAGYEGDPRLRGAALRLLQRVMKHVRSPLASDPWQMSGGKRVLAPGAAPPSYFLLLMLAHMPLFRLEHASEMDELLKYLTNASADDQGSGSALAAQRLILTRDPLAAEDAANGDIGSVLSWLELAARLGFLKRHEGWTRAFDRLLEQCDEMFVWRTRRGQGGPAVGASRTSNSFVWPTYPLGPNATADDQAAEVTFRLGLIARFSGRPLELV
ncbi:MAG: hypothetical protein ACT4P6_14335 [Gemmatimonadaceae bacterium]